MTSHRRYDLDWIRVLVFGILILFHSGMFFTPWDWHIKNNQLSEYFVIPMAFSHQWRLAILFVVSGMGTSFALSFRPGKVYLFERTKKLLVPLIFGVLFIIPPQVYIERIVDGEQFSSIFDYYPHMFDGIYPEGNLSWHHLWFLPYLYLFSLIFLPIFLIIRNNYESGFMTFIKTITEKHPSSLFLWAVPLVIIRATLNPYFPVTGALYGDWFALSYYGLFFFFGFLFSSMKNSFWQSVEKIKYMALIGGIVSFTLYGYSEENQLNYTLISVFKICNAWCWILTIFGFATVWLNHTSKLLTYCNKAVYPFYILHQTVTIILAYFIMDKSWSIGLKFIFLVVFTFVLCWLMYEFIIRRTKALWAFFGLFTVEKTKS